MSRSLRVRLRARAKLNLDLRILGIRSDGYHELRTIFQTIALHDVVTVESSHGPLELDGDGERMPLDQTNLAWRAATRLWRAAGRSGPPSGARITIDKRIPAQAGLGGGSTDAAASLVGLNHVWRLGCSHARLHDIAARLGADVPFFLLGGAALGLGRGDELYPLVDLPACHVVLAWPGDGMSTADAYAWHRHRPAGTLRRESAARVEALMEGNLAGLRNDLEAAVEARRPEIRQIRRELTAARPLAARMSGSGSAVFALFSSAAAAGRAATRVSGPGRHVVVTRTLGRLAGGHRVV